MPVRELADAWSSFYSNSAAIRSTVAFAHVGGLVAGGGCAITADRATLRALKRGGPSLASEIDRLQGAHRIVLAGLAAVGVSGVLLLLANLDGYVASKTFWIKMVLVAGLFLNGAWLAREASRVGSGNAPNGKSLRAACFTSLFLWFATTLAGTVLPNVL
jgi:hypothetical protein